MKIVLAPDSFKGSMTSLEVIEAMAASIERNWGKQDIRRVPVADGGEGTMEALVIAAGGKYVRARVMDAIGEYFDAAYGVIGEDTAVVELAAVAGLGMTPRESQNPLKTTTRGVGELIKKALEDGYKKLLVGIGGSATNDGGMGLLAALGASFYDGEKELFGRGEDLERVTRIDLKGLPDLSAIEIRVICDVTNPLLGPDGATYIYGPQKGASGEMLKRLEAGMENYARVFSEQHGLDIVTMPGAGAAGGAGAALGCVLRAELCRGIDAVLEAVGFEAMIKDADLVVTGEGRLDGQSVRFGKGIVGIAKRCKQYEVPVAILVGGLGEGWEGVYDVADCSVMTAVDGPMTVEQAINEAETLIPRAADRMFRFMKLMGGLSLESVD